MLKRQMLCDFVVTCFICSESCAFLVVGRATNPKPTTPTRIHAIHLLYSLVLSIHFLTSGHSFSWLKWNPLRSTGQGCLQSCHWCEGCWVIHIENKSQHVAVRRTPPTLERCREALDGQEMNGHGRWGINAKTKTRSRYCESRKCRLTDGKKIGQKLSTFASNYEFLWQ